VQELQLECRFEAFRTVKGTEKSVREGIQAQYTLMSNPREEAFGILAQS
jgi:ASC-1-like (ASCH) protein